MFATAFLKVESLGQNPRLRISVDLDLCSNNRSYLPPTSPCRNVGGDAFFVAHQKQKCRRIKALGTKNSITKKPMPEKLLQKPKMCVIIHLGCRLSGCIGVPVSLLCRAVVLQYGSPPFCFMGLLYTFSEGLSIYLRNLECVALTARRRIWSASLV